MKYTEIKNKLIKDRNIIKRFYYDRANDYERNSQQYFELKLVTALSLYQHDYRHSITCWRNREDGTHNEFLKNDSEDLKFSMVDLAKSYSDNFNCNVNEFKYFSFNREYACQVEIEQEQYLPKEVKEEPRQQFSMGFIDTNKL